MKTIANHWLELIEAIGFLLFAAAVFIQIKYYFDLHSLKSRTAKYKFATANESHQLRKASYFFAGAIGMLFFQSVVTGVGNVLPFQFFFIGFFAIIIAYAVGFSCWAILKYYYPFILEKRLNKIRFKPMISKKTGQSFVLLNENEEDAHMTKVMLEEENAFSADYDVWFNENTGEKVIEKYDTHNHYLVCEECNFRTLKDIKETITIEPTNTTEGELQKEYRCSYCGHKEIKKMPIPSWIEENSYA